MTSIRPNNGMISQIEAKIPNLSQTSSPTCLVGTQLYERKVFPMSRHDPSMSQYSNEMLDALRLEFVSQVQQGEDDDITVLALSRTLTEQAKRVIENKEEEGVL